ncbi:hypothetical protein [Pseudomonas mosselii]|uniref:hypothetical protein n=1 Tax=Pseudomonas mosselii TaxID=78327 RepID=UPI002022BC26|nr:hypothetical protein [Pseudomonas mosselii]MCL8303260.1 hypothetical protein [Pseudomonas mosselii]
MTLEERMDLADQLRKVLSDALAHKICTGNAQQMRERKHELARLMARVSAVVMYDGMPESEQIFRTRRLENQMREFADSDANHLWPASTLDEG